MKALLFGAVLVWVGGCSAQSDPGGGAAHRLRYASPYAPTHPFSRADIAWIDHVQAQAQGRLRIEPFWAGALLSTDQSMLELRHGVSDMGVITPIYARGGAHVLRAQAGFYRGARSFTSQVAVYKCLAREFAPFASELAGLRVLAIQGGNLPGLFTRDRPVRTLEDLAGLRLRAPAELTGVLEHLGADPVSMPMGDVYSSLSKGIIDGVVAPADALRSLHLAEVGHYFTALEVPRGAYPARAISEAAWARLPSDLRDILDRSSAFWEAALEQELTAASTRGERYAREKRVAWLEVAPAVQQRFEAAYNRSALDGARELSEVGVEGVPIFERAQALIARVETGATNPCSE